MIFQKSTGDISSEGKSKYEYPGLSLHLNSLIGWFDPRFTLFQQVYQLIHRDLAVHITLHHFFTFIQRDLSWSTAYVTKISVGHFTGTIYDTSHNSDLHS